MPTKEESASGEDRSNNYDKNTNGINCRPDIAH